MRVKVWKRGYAGNDVGTLEVADDLEIGEIDRLVTERFGPTASVAEIVRPRPEVEPGYARAMTFRDNS